MVLSDEQVDALAALLVGLQQKAGQRHVRDVDYWDAPYGTPLPLPPGFKKPKEVFKKRPKISPEKAKRAKFARLDVKDADPEVVAAARDITEMKWNGFSTTVNLRKSSLENGVFWISGDIYKNGKKVGFYQRVLDYEDREMENAGLVLNPSVQGQGFAERFYKHVDEKAYEQGIRRVRIYANIDVGGYAWARRGFNFRDPTQRELFKDVVQMFADSEPGEIITLYGVDYTLTPSIIAQAQRLLRRWRSVTPLELSQLGERARSMRTTKTTKGGRTVPMWPGKSLLLGSGWLGIKPLIKPKGKKDAVENYMDQIEKLIPYAETMFIPDDVFEPHKGNESDYNILGADLFYDPPINFVADLETKVEFGTYEEKGVRRVRDVEYWGMPYGTVITPGMKPRSLTRIADADIPAMGSVRYSEDNPPPYLYRAVSEEDWRGIQESGFMQSDERMNVADNEGTVAADRDPSFYLPRNIGAQGRILRIKYDPADMWWRDSDGYWKTPSKIPLSRIDATTDLYVDQEKPEDYTPARLLYNFRNKITRAIQDVPGYEGYGIPAALREYEYQNGNVLYRGEVTKESLTKYLDDLDTYLTELSTDVEENMFNADQKTYDDLVSNVRPLISQARETLKQPGIFDNPEPEYRSAIQMRLPGMPKMPEVPESDNERLDRIRENDDRDGARRSARYMQSLIDTYNRWLFDDMGGDEITRAENQLYGEFGVQVADLEYGERNGDQVISSGDWTKFGGCRQIREATYDILGFEWRDVFADPNLYGGDPGWGGVDWQASRPAASAYHILEKLRDGERSDMPLYRGVGIFGFDQETFVSDLKAGDTFDLPVASFTGDETTARAFGEDILFKVERGARYVQGTFMGIPDSVMQQLQEQSGSPIYEEDFYEDLKYSELVSGGRFKVTHVKQDGATFIVTIKQVGVFDPDTGLAKKAINRRWKYAYLFDNSLPALMADAVVPRVENRDTRSNKPGKAKRGSDAR